MNDPIKSLELDVILRQVAGFAATASAQESIISTKPSASLDEVDELLIYTNQAVTAITELRFSGIERFEPIDDILEKTVIGGVLTMKELLEVAGVLSSARVAKNTLMTYPQKIEKLVDIGGRMYVNEALENDIRKKILNENEMSDNASGALRDIRIKIKTVKNRLYEKLGSFTRSNVYSKYLQDNLYTVRNGRYVLPVKSECRQDVKGLLHDQSSSGATVFIEPYEIVEANNEVIKLEGDEHREIERILAELSGNVGECSDWLAACQQQLTYLDVLVSKARYSVSIDGILPKTNYAGKIELSGARHPLIDPKKVVSVDISLGRDANILLISGPNTGGKTASLKTVGLLSLMMCCGLFIPCRSGSEMAVFDHIYCDIGDAQDIRQSLSTFSSHIKNLKEITDSFTNESLILLDEIGSCTDPVEGAAIAVGVMQYISKTKAKAIITTHYPQLKEFALLSENIKNAGMQFDPLTLKPTFKLLIGYPGSSNAIETAEALGLSKTVLDIARAQLMPGNEKNYEELIREAGQIKAQAEAQLSEAVKLKSEAEGKLNLIDQQEKKVSDALSKINQNAKTETRRLVAKAVDNLNEMVDEVKTKLKGEDERSLLAAKKLIKQIDNISYGLNEEPTAALHRKFKPGELKEGVEAVILSLGAKGIIKKLKTGRDEAEVSVDGITVKAKISDLAAPVSHTKKPASKALSAKPANSNSMPKNYEINVIGKTVSEAIETIEPIVLGAAEMNIAVLRIVHGKGTGILGRGIQQFLKSEKNIKSYRYGGYGEGDHGVTIVEFK